MVKRYCCLDSCPNFKDCTSSLNLFLPPKDPTLFAKWEEMVKPYRRLPLKKYSGVCEKHFQPDDILREFVTKLKDGTEHKLARGRVSLKPGVYPTVFGKEFKKKPQSNCIEVKAPSSSEKEVTYIFDVGDDDPEEEEDSQKFDEPHGKGDNEGKLSGEPIKRKRGRPSKFQNMVEHLNDCEDDVSDVVVGNESPDEVNDDLFDRGNDDGISGISDDATDDHYNNECQENMDDNERNHTKMLKILKPEPIESDHDYQSSCEKNNLNSPEVLRGTDLRTILGEDDDTGESIINNVEAFSRLCRSYIVSKVKSRGRKSDLDLYCPPLSKKFRKTEEEVFIYPTANNLDVMTLVYNIDRVKYPSNNWFLTIKDGAPAFLCWGEGFNIAKKVIFDSRNLDPTIIIGEGEVKMSEVIRPRSIKEVSSILKLADSVELCTQNIDKTRLNINCKGYFFRSQTDDPLITLCYQCRLENSLEPIEEKTSDSLSFKEICRVARSLVVERELWSHTIIGSALVFLGWWKSYNIELMYIINRDLSTKVQIGGQFVVIDEIKQIKAIDDITLALNFLSNCRKCYGIKNFDTKWDTRRAKDCRGFVAGESRLARVLRCKSCLDVKTKLGKRNRKQRMKGQFVRCSDSYPPLKARTSVSEKTNFEEELAIEDDELSDEGWLVDVLEKVTFPSTAWSYVVVENSIIFQNWGYCFVVMKKIIINPDLNVQIYVLDHHVEIEAIQTVENVDDVMRLLNVVDCIQICEGMDSIDSKSEGCTGYYYNPNAKNLDPDLPKRCPKCEKEHAMCSKREQRWMKKIAMSLANLTPSDEISMNAKECEAEQSVVVEGAEDEPSISSSR